jgi:hypothetical protein
VQKVASVPRKMQALPKNGNYNGSYNDKDSDNGGGGSAG